MEKNGSFNVFPESAGILEWAGLIKQRPVLF